LYSSTDIITVIKSKTKRQVGRVARIGEKINAYKIFVSKPTQEKKKKLSGYMAINGNII
jgi:hypothetical protein